jgi:hypothetical protein
MKEAFKDRGHILRLAGLFLAGFIVFLVFRGLMVPAGFGELGHFRSGALHDNREQEAQYAGHEACELCHEEVAEARARSLHASISCETCHGPLARHADDPSAMTPARPDASAVCVGCHAALTGRPDWLPQVVPDEHAEGEPCDGCHDVHAPGV